MLVLTFLVVQHIDANDGKVFGIQIGMNQPSDFPSARRKPSRIRGL